MIFFLSFSVFLVLFVFCFQGQDGSTAAEWASNSENRMSEAFTGGPFPVVWLSAGGNDYLESGPSTLFFLFLLLLPLSLLLLLLLLFSPLSRVEIVYVPSHFKFFFFLVY